MSKGELATADVFDYGDLDKPVVKSLETHAKAIAITKQQVRRTTAEGVLKLGEHLKAVHDLLAGHGRDGMFGPWVKQRCEFTVQTAQKAIAVYDVFGKMKHVSSFDASALYVLSAESCPEEATEEAIKLAESGTPVTHKLAKEIKSKYVEPEPEPDAEQCTEDFGSFDHADFIVQSSVIVSRYRKTATEAERRSMAEHLRALAESLEASE